MGQPEANAPPRDRGRISVDEYRLVVHPIALGEGLAAFDGLEQPRALKLVSSSTFPGGATAQIFARDR